MHMKCSLLSLLDVSKEDCTEQCLSDLPESTSGADRSGQPPTLSHHRYFWLCSFCHISSFFYVIFFSDQELYPISRQDFISS